MAKQFTVRAKFIAEDDASRVISKIQQAQESLAREVAESTQSFDRGELSVEEYTQSINRAAAEQRKLDSALSATRGEIGQTSTRFDRFGASIRKNAIGISAAIAGLATAFRQVRKSADEAGQARSFERALQQQGVAADQFIAKLKEISDNQIATSDLILSTNRALALGIRAEDIPGLLDTAARASVDLGVSVSRAFEDITTGVGRASPLILDNLGIVIDLTKVYQDFADSIGVSVEELTKQQKTVALTKAVMGEAAEATGNFSEAQDDLARRINQSQAALSNLSSAFGTLAGGVLQGFVSGLAVTATALSLVAEGAIKAGSAIVQLGSALPLVGGAFEGVAGFLQSVDDGLDKFQQKAIAFATTTGKGFIASLESTGSSLGLIDKNARSASEAFGGLSSATRSTADEAGNAALQTNALRNATSGLGNVADRTARSIDREGQAARRAAGAFQQLAFAKQLAGAGGGGDALVSAFGGRVQTADGGQRLVRADGRGGSVDPGTAGGLPGGGSFQPTTVTPATTARGNIILR